MLASSKSPFWEKICNDAAAGATSLVGSPFPRITIVIPAISGDEYLEATLRSVIFQDYPNLELIVIEDGTSSERRRILKKYEAHFSWQICPPATELCAALNMAFAKSSGEILGWLEPGDSFTRMVCT